MAGGHCARARAPDRSRTSRRTGQAYLRFAEERADRLWRRASSNHQGRELGAETKSIESRGQPPTDRGRRSASREAYPDDWGQIFSALSPAAVGARTIFTRKWDHTQTRWTADSLRPFHAAQLGAKAVRITTLKAGTTLFPFLQSIPPRASMSKVLTRTVFATVGA